MVNRYTLPTDLRTKLRKIFMTSQKILVSEIKISEDIVLFPVVIK